MVHSIFDEESDFGLYFSSYRNTLKSIIFFLY